MSTNLLFPGKVQMASLSSSKRLREENFDVSIAPSAHKRPKNASPHSSMRLPSIAEDNVSFVYDREMEVRCTP